MCLMLKHLAPLVIAPALDSSRVPWRLQRLPHSDVQTAHVPVARAANVPPYRRHPLEMPLKRSPALLARQSKQP